MQKILGKGPNSYFANWFVTLVGHDLILTWLVVDRTPNCSAEQPNIGFSVFVQCSAEHQNQVFGPSAHVSNNKIGILNQEDFGF